MRDCKLFYDEGFDVDFSSTGDPVYVDTAEQTNDQRAAVACTIISGTIPSALSVGVDWGSVYDNLEENIVSLDNQCKQMIENCSTSDGTATTQYVPLYVPNDDGTISVTTVKGMAS